MFSSKSAKLVKKSLLLTGNERMSQDVIIENQIDEFKITYVSNDEKRKNLEKAILDFFISNEVIAEETIYQSDSVNEKCQELVEELYGIINFDVQCENL